MQAYSQGMKTISNDVANLDTLGYKASTLSFSDIFSQPDGSLGYVTSQSGGSTGSGVKYNKETIDFTAGTMQQTGGALDLAIDGNGFLAVQDKNGDTFYAKTGQFSVDSNGYVVNQSGDRLTILDTANQPLAVNITNHKTFAPAATTTVTFGQNLSSSATTADVPNIKVYDSDGVAHTWDVSLVPGTATASSGTTTNWTVTVKDETGASVGTGTISFNGGVSVPGSSSIVINTTPSGAKALDVTLDFSGVSSFSAGTTNTLATSKVDGNAIGTLSSVTVNSQGQVVLAYSNSQTTVLGSVALASFEDQEQLTRIGSGLFKNSGKNAVHFNASGANGAGSLLAGQVEASNVNLTAEFGNLILIQRGFDASSQVVSATNDMIQQLFGMRGHG
jgi:flagellar hook protein FlgE